MEEHDLKFFKMAIASVLGILILLLVTSIFIAFYSVGEADTYAPSTTNTYVPQTQQPYTNNDRYAEDESISNPCGRDPCQKQYENINVPPCADPCKMRVEYTNKYFLPYPKYTYDRYYYEPYPVYPQYNYEHYPVNQRFFHHKIVQRDYTY